MARAGAKRKAAVAAEKAAAATAEAGEKAASTAAAELLEKETTSNKRVKTDDSEQQPADEAGEQPPYANDAAADAAKEGDTKEATPAPKKTPKKRTASVKVASSTATGDAIVENFDHYLFQLIAFKAETGNFHVSKEEHGELYNWLQFLKKEYKLFASGGSKKGSLTQEQVKVLEFLFVPLTSRGEDHWNRFYDLLKEYGDRHGHVLVPRLCETPGLGDWVTDQRRQYKAWKQGQTSQLSTERREKLEALGFAWQVRNRPEWDNRFKELMDYKKKNGDCKVPQHYKDNKALGKWVAKQREQHRLLKKGQHSFLTPFRMEKLNQAGFSWQIRSSFDTEDMGSTPAKGSGAKAEEEEESTAAGEKEESAAKKKPAAKAKVAEKEEADTKEAPDEANAEPITASV